MNKYTKAVQKLCLILAITVLVACSNPHPVEITVADGQEEASTVEQPANTPEKDQASESEPIVELQPENAPAEQADIAPFSWDDRGVFRAGLITEAQAVLDELPGASVYKIEFNISDDKLHLAGKETVAYTNREQVALEQIYFQLFPNHSGGSSVVSNVMIDDAPVEPEYVDDRRAVRIALPKPLEPGERITVGMDFKVDVALEMAGNYGTFGYFDDILVLDEFYPVIPVHDQDGWQYHVPNNGDLTYLDASFYHVTVTAPKKLVLVASGIELDNQRSSKEQTVTYVAGPARDFYLAASDKFKSISQQVGETTINSYAFANEKAGSENALRFGEEALRIFNRRYGTYPYTEMDIVSTPMQALGIEYPGIMGITLVIYDTSGSSYGLPNPVMMQSVVAHEVGHQWFYNTVGNDQIREPWLDEAVVQYITGLYFKDRGGEASFNSLRDSWYSRWDRVDRAEIPIGKPSEEYTPQEYSPIVYGRGPLFIDALQQQMGEEAFDEFLHDYYQSNIWEIGYAEEFKTLAEEHCDCDLTALFEAWVW